MSSTFIGREMKRDLVSTIEDPGETVKPTVENLLSGGDFVNAIRSTSIVALNL